MTIELLRAAMAVLLRIPVGEVDEDFLRDIVRADGRVLRPVLTLEERRQALGGIEPYTIWRDGEDTYFQVHS